MDETKLRTLLEDLAAGARSVEECVEALRRLPFADLGFAKVDLHRQLRSGAPEVVYAPGKDASHLRAIASRLLAEAGSPILVTRAEPEQWAQLEDLAPEVTYDPLSRLAVLRRVAPDPASGCVAVLSAGTSDLPVAEEAAGTVEAFGIAVVRLYDVGAAGVHRLLAHEGLLRAADVLIVVAGMEGALASLAAGLIACPVVAVPTSVGYGASFGGLAALLAMLNSCAAGTVVVNIDNGFGAGIHSVRILRGRTAPVEGDGKAVAGRGAATAAVAPESGTDSAVAPFVGTGKGRAAGRNVVEAEEPGPGGGAAR